jgi:hypothetical protein
VALDAASNALPLASLALIDAADALPLAALALPAAANALPLASLALIDAADALPLAALALPAAALAFVSASLTADICQFMAASSSGLSVSACHATNALALFANVVWSSPRIGAAGGVVIVGLGGSATLEFLDSDG